MKQAHDTNACVIVYALIFYSWSKLNIQNSRFVFVKLEISVSKDNMTSMEIPFLFYILSSVTQVKQLQYGLNIKHGTVSAKYS